MRSMDTRKILDMIATFHSRSQGGQKHEGIIVQQTNERDHYITQFQKSSKG